MIGSVSGAGAGQSVTLSREMREMLNALSVQQANELKLATMAIKGTASVQKQSAATASLIDIMA